MTPQVNDQRMVAQLANRFRAKRILVVMGGLSAERPISLKTGKAVLSALQGLNLKVQGLDLRRAADLNKITRWRPDLVLLCLHGPLGEDGTIQGFLELTRLRYTGCRVLSSALAMDKYRSKLLMQMAGLPTPAGWLLHAGNQWQLPNAANVPLVVKPNRQGSAIGVSIVKQRGQLARAIKKAREFDDEILVEKFCPGMEISVGVLIDQVLPVIEIVPRHEFYDYESKYQPGMSEHIIPARLKPNCLKQAQALALDAFQTLGCRGISRVDLIVNPSGKFTILEVNTMPGLTVTSLFPDAARHAGISFEQVVLRLMLDGYGE